MPQTLIHHRYYKTLTTLLVQFCLRVFAARGSRGQNYFERAPPSLFGRNLQRVGPGMTLSCAVFLLLAAADLTMAINCTVHTALPECISDKIYTAIVATVGTTLAIVIGIFIVGVLLIRRQRSAPVSSNSAAEAERGTYYGLYISGRHAHNFCCFYFLFLFW